MIRAKTIILEVIRMLLLLFGVSLVAFVLITKAPIDPLVSYIGTNSTLSSEAKEEISEYWGLNDPLPERFVTWISHAVKGDLGQSITYKKPVIDVIKERVAYSFVLMLLAWVLSGILGFVIGIICGLHPGSLFDRGIKVFCLALKSAPTFWLGLMVLTIFAVQLGWFPVGMAAPVGKLAADVTLGDRIYHLVLPVFTLTIVSISEVVLYTRQKLIEIMNSDFILYARTRGESMGQLVRRHVLRNIALPALTIQFTPYPVRIERKESLDEEDEESQEDHESVHYDEGQCVLLPVHVFLRIDPAYAVERVLHLCEGLVAYCFLSCRYLEHVPSCRDDRDAEDKQEQYYL